MKRMLPILLSMTVIGVSPALADDGFSLGASIGYANIKDNEPDFDFDAQDTGYKIFANYTFANFLGLEGAYVDFGEPSDQFAGLSGVIDAQGWSLYGVGALPLGSSVEVFGKAGVISWDADSLVDGVLVGADDGNDLALGIGARWNANESIGIRAEYEWFDIPDADNVWMASLGLVVRF
jgi:opacity protein-like surface antigen